MKQGCILVNPKLVADPEIFDCLLEQFTFVRQLEVDQNTHVLILENNSFKDVPIGGRLYFYDLDFARNKATGELYLSNISTAFYHHNLNFICQKKEEPPKPEETQETDLWPGLM